MDRSLARSLQWIAPSDRIIIQLGLHEPVRESLSRFNAGDAHWSLIPYLQWMLTLAPLGGVCGKFFNLTRELSSGLLRPGCIMGACRYSHDPK
jgi:hypothetical protein